MAPVHNHGPHFASKQNILKLSVEQMLEHTHAHMHKMNDMYII